VVTGAGEDVAPPDDRLARRTSSMISQTRVIDRIVARRKEIVREMVSRRDVPMQFDAVEHDVCVRCPQNTGKKKFFSLSSGGF
jgi:hypothetical protein